VNVPAAEFGGAEDESPVPLVGSDGQSWGDLRSYLQIRSIEWAGMHLPREIGLWAADAYQRALFARSLGLRETVARNLGRVLDHPPDSPLVQAATRECFLLYGRYWYETFALRTMPWDEVDRRFTVDGLEHVERALEAGRGTILVLPHMGNWDAAGHWLCINGYKMAAVAEELKPRSVFDLFLRHRRALGMGIVPLTDGKKVGEKLVSLLMDNTIITLVADRDLTGRGVEVEMFGAKRLLPAGPARLSLGTGSPLSVCAVFTTRDGWHCRIGAPVEIERTGDTRADVTTMTRIIAAGFERYIAAAPTDWHMFQPAWEEDERLPPGHESSLATMA
jgi:phosphatidylinositol dimannoside acyltransferase